MELYTKPRNFTGGGINVDDLIGVYAATMSSKPRQIQTSIKQWRATAETLRSRCNYTAASVADEFANSIERVLNEASKMP